MIHAQFPKLRRKAKMEVNYLDEPPGTSSVLASLYSKEKR